MQFLLFKIKLPKGVSTMHTSDLHTPCLVVYKERVERNAIKMIERCKEYGVNLRPHFKTSKVVEVAELQTGGSKRGMVVSTLPEAIALAENGFDDILYGCPLSEDKIERCQSLNEKLDQFHVMIDNLEVAKLLCNYKASVSHTKWSVFLGVDCGYHRDGILHSSKEAVELATFIHNAENMIFQGLYTHCGQSYRSSQQNTVSKIAEEVAEALLSLVKRLGSVGIQCKNYGMGSTPTCSHPTKTMKNLTEWHPGNYIFYDMMQESFGSCSKNDIACAVATRVVGHYSGEGFHHLLVDCGFTALTLQGEDKGHHGGFGVIADHPDLKLSGMTQELGKVTRVDGGSIDFEKYPIGLMMFILPYHSCATCAMHPVYYVADESGKIVDKWIPVRGW